MIWLVCYVMFIVYLNYELDKFVDNINPYNWNKKNG